MMNKRAVYGKVQCKFVEHEILKKPLSSQLVQFVNESVSNRFERFGFRPVVNKEPPFRLFVACADTQSHSLLLVVHSLFVLL
jgi:hypothetical protein